MSAAKDDNSKLSQTFNPGQTDWQRTRTRAQAEAEFRVDAALKAATAFDRGYATAFERLIRTDDLVCLLSNFARMLQDKAEPTDDGWLTESKLFVGKLDSSPHMTRSFPDWNAPIDRDHIVWLRNMPSLNTAAFGVLQQEVIDAEEEAAAAKLAQV